MNFKKLLLFGFAAGMLFNVPMISAMEQEKTQDTAASFEAQFKSIPEGRLASAREQGYSKYGRLGYTFYKKNNNGHLAVLSTEELNELGVSFSNEPGAYSRHCAGEHPYATGNTAIVTGGTATTVFGKAMGWWRLRSGFAVTGLTMAAYTGGLWLYDALNNEKAVQATSVSQEQQTDSSDRVQKGFLEQKLLTDANRIFRGNPAQNKQFFITFAEKKKLDVQGEIDVFYDSTRENVQQNLDVLTDKFSFSRFFVFDVPQISNEQSSKEEAGVEDRSPSKEEAQKIRAQIIACIKSVLHDGAEAFDTDFAELKKSIKEKLKSDWNFGEWLNERLLQLVNEHSNTNDFQGTEDFPEPFCILLQELNDNLGMNITYQDLQDHSYTATYRSVDELANKPSQKKLPVPVKKKPVKKEETLFVEDKATEMRAKSYLTVDASSIVQGKGTLYREELLNFEMLVPSQNSFLKETKSIRDVEELKNLVDKFYQSGPENVQQNLNNLTNALGIERIKVEVPQKPQRRVN